MYRVVELLNDQTVESLKLKIKGFLINKKTLCEDESKLIHGTEYDLTYCREFDWLKTLVEEVCSFICDKPLHISNFWISISEPNTVVISHNHMDGEYENFYSAVLYINAKDNCGELFLENYEINITPQKGFLVCFPSQCNHSVSNNNSNEDRVCIAFDLRLNK